MAWAVCLTTAFSICVSNALTTIGILTVPSGLVDGRQRGTEELPSAYIDWLIAGGADYVIPIPSGVTWNTTSAWWTFELYSAWTPNQYRKVFSEINGLVLPGGDPWMTVSSPVFRQLYQFALEAAANGSRFPIWGTCAGFEALVAMAAGGCQAKVTDGAIPTGTCAEEGPIQRGFDSVGVSFPLVLTADAKRSRLLNSIPSSVLAAAQIENVTEHSHAGGATKDVFYSNVNITKMYQALSTNVDKNGNEFISTIEGVTLPFYGTQWHPEMSEYTFPNKPDAIALARDFAAFFVSEASKNSNAFASEVDAKAASIDKYTPYQWVYYFNWTAEAFMDVVPVSSVALATWRSFEEGKLFAREKDVASQIMDNGVTFVPALMVFGIFSCCWLVAGLVALVRKQGIQDMFHPTDTETRNADVSGVEMLDKDLIIHVE